MFIKRRRLLTLCLLLAYGAMFLGVPVVIIFVLSSSKNPNSETSKALEVAAFFGMNILIFPASIILEYIHMARIWLLYYDMLLSKIQKNREWRMIIDPKTSNIIDNESKFALKNQNRLYKTKPILKICIIAFCIEYVIIAFPLILILNWISPGPILTMDNVGGSFWMPYMVLMLSIRLFVCFYLWGRMKRLKMIDNFGIRKEIGYLFMQSIFCVLVIVCLIILNIVVTTILGLLDDSIDDSIIPITMFYTILFLGIGHLYIVFTYPIKVHNNIMGCEDDAYVAKKKRSTRFGSSDATKSINHWTQIMSTEVGYEEFMDYLAQEFSTENLLFITEYIEVKKVLANHFGKILEKLKEKHAGDYGFFVEFDTLANDEYENMENRANISIGIRTFSVSDIKDNCSHSLIARELNEELIKFRNNNNKDLELEDNHGDEENYQNMVAVGIRDCIISAFSRIYSKYIDDYSASFMINLSHRNRESLSKLFVSNKFSENSNINIAINKLSCNDKDDHGDIDCQIESLLQVLIKDMENACKEISTLMQDSFFRFKREKKHLFQYMLESVSESAGV